MPTLFTRIIAGELPGRFVWRDPRCAAFMSKDPLRAGHTLVVPVDEVDHWIDMPAGVAAHVFEVSRVVGEALQRAFRPARVGLVIAGMEVPHVHVHLVPIDSLRDLDFARAQVDADQGAIGEAAAAIRRELAAMGRTETAER